MSNSVQCPLRQLRGTEKQGQNTTPHLPGQSFFVQRTSIFVTLDPRLSFVRTKITSAWSFIVIHVSVFLSVYVFVALWFCVCVGGCLCLWVSWFLLFYVTVFLCVSLCLCLSFCVCLCVCVCESTYVQTYCNNIEQKELCTKHNHP